MVGLPRSLRALGRRSYRIWKAVRGFAQDSPVAFSLILLLIALIILTVSLFSCTVARYIGSRATVVVDLSLFWLFARLVARVLLFPGSLKLFQRNTEATFRNEMARQYVHYLRQLWTFLAHASRQSEGILRGVSADGVVRGCTVVETLAASFHMQQQQHEVTLSREQTEMHAVARDIEHWLKGLKVRQGKVTLPGDARSGVRRESPGAGAEGQPQPLVEWVRRQAAVAASGGGHFGAAGMSTLHALMSAELAGDLDEARRHIEKVAQLLTMLDDLRQQQKGMFRTALRFFRTPAIGSLNQLRTELQTKYAGHRCWVPTRRGHRLDCMFLPADAGQAPGGDEAQPEESLLNGSRPPSFAGATVIWCNPNAAYYETMVYQSSWLNFWLSQGLNIFLFNYAGYGQSTGSPSPARIAEDGDAVIRFLKGKGTTRIGIYGRSIGGVTACHLARRHPDVVQLLIADRTMSTLHDAAKFLYGSWAGKGLQATNMMADNVDHFFEVRCYKLLIVDPKDTMILDSAALRTGIAMRVVERQAPEERFVVDDEKLLALAEVWQFFGCMFAICEGEDDLHYGLDSVSARQPTFIRDDHNKDVRLKAGDGAGGGGGAGGECVGMEWLIDNAGVVRSTMAPFADQIRSALDVVGEHLEGSGICINDIFLDHPGDPIAHLKSMLANIQVWGTVGDQREDGEQLSSLEGSDMSKSPGAPGAADGAAGTTRDIECFLRKEYASSDFMQPQESREQLSELSRLLAPEMLAAYHRRLSRLRVAQVLREFKRRLIALQHAFEHTAFAAPGAGSSGSASEAQSDRLQLSVMARLAEVESFVAALGRFFKTVDLSLPYSRQQEEHSKRGPRKEGQDGPLGSDSSDEKLLETGQGAGSAACDVPAVTPQPAIDHALAGYLMHVDCGHNGALDEVDLRQLALHLRSASFGQGAA